MLSLRNLALGDRRLRRGEDGGRGGGWDEAGGMACGLVAGTKVATSIGWRAVEMVTPGDRVLTFDNGMQVVTRVEHGVLWNSRSPCPRHLWPLYVPAGALGNAQPLVMLPEQSVMVESDVGEEIYGDPFTLIPAATLDGFRGITRLAPEGQVPVATLHFDRDQVVFASAGALFFCPSGGVMTIADLMQGAESPYSVLSPEEAGFLIGCIRVDDRDIRSEGRAAA